MKYLFVCIFFLPLFSLAQQRSNNVNEALKLEIKEALGNKSVKQILVAQVIPDKETAIAVSEQILFKIYGKDKIISEKPYNVYWVDGYWILSGTLPEGYLGGTFLIILSSKDGRVIKLTHGK